MKTKIKVAILLSMIFVLCSFSTAFARSNIAESDQQEGIVQPMYVPCPSCGTGMLVKEIGDYDDYIDGKDCEHGCVDALDILHIYRHEEYDQCTNCGYIQDREWVIDRIEMADCASYEHSPSCPFGD